jgi:hypothetical protein
VRCSGCRAGADLAKIEQVIAQGTRTSGGTAFYSAVLESLQYVPSGDTQHEYWLCALTDGEDFDRSLEHTLPQQLAAANCHALFITVGLSSVQRIEQMCAAVTAAGKTGMVLPALTSDESIRQAFQQVRVLCTLTQVCTEFCISSLACSTLTCRTPTCRTLECGTLTYSTLENHVLACTAPGPRQYVYAVQYNRFHQER